MKQKYSVIVFDLGNVLLPFDFNDVIQGFEEIEKGLGVKFAEFYRTNYEVHRKFERGEYSVDEFTEIMLGVLEQKVARKEFYRIYSGLFSVNEELVKLLPVLGKNYRLVVLSNTNALHRKYGWGSYEFLGNFEKLILSHEIGAVKPEEKIYRAVEAYTGVPPEEHLYTDDILEYAAAARSLGWDAVQFVGNEELIREFGKRGIPLDGDLRD
ncbi:MAG: HAD family phosphatase [Bacteroidetes bacterium]|nr:HAD family phosphatase [Bacteroidota bacterium]